MAFSLWQPTLYVFFGGFFGYPFVHSLRDHMHWAPVSILKGTFFLLILRVACQSLGPGLPCWMVATNISSPSSGLSHVTAHTLGVFEVDRHILVKHFFSSTLVAVKASSITPVFPPGALLFWAVSLCLVSFFAFVNFTHFL